MKNIFHDLIKIFTIDADFRFANGARHYKKHLDDNELPAGMTEKQYMEKAKEVSLKNIGGSVKAYKFAGNRVGKFDGTWYVSYANGKGGDVVTAFPLRGGYGRFEELRKKFDGTYIEKE